MYCVWISEQTATSALYEINYMVLCNCGGQCLLRGTHRVLIYSGADKSLARPGMKQANVSLRMA